MTRIGWLWAALLSFCLAGPGAAAPLEAYGHLPFIEQAEISPDGASLALIVTRGDNRRILIERLSDGKMIGGLNAGDSKVRWLQWAGPSHLLITASTTTSIMDVSAPRDEWYTTLDYDIARNAQHHMMEDAGDGLNVVMGAPAIRIIAGKPYAFVTGVHFVSNQGRLSLFKVDLERGHTVLAEEGFENTGEWVVDADGRALAESEFNGRTLHWTLKVHRPNGWRTVKTADGALEHPSLMGLGRDGRAILLAATVDGRDVLRELAPDGDDWGEPFAPDSQGSVFDPASERLIGAYALVGDEGRYTFFSPADQAIWSAVVRAYPGEQVTLASASADHRKVVVRVDSPTEGPAYAYVDVTAGKGIWLGSEYDGIKPADISPVKALTFKAADGTDLSGYLTLPKGREAKSLPLVVFPHGGPAARDAPGFDWWAQAMASRGYAVLQVNFRGSYGLGRKHLEAGYGQWGRKMQTDLSDGVRYISSQGIVDPKRVCIVGASYGGYAALAGATLDPSVYRCAAAVAGIADPGRFIAWSKTQNGSGSQKYWSRFMGVEGSRDPDLVAISPVAHADQASGPILLVHGKDDTVVPFSQSQMMADALTRAGKTVEFVTLKREDHWLSHGETRLQMLQAVVTFLEKNNPPT